MLRRRAWRTLSWPIIAQQDSSCRAEGWRVDEPGPHHLVPPAIRSTFSRQSTGKPLNPGLLACASRHKVRPTKRGGRITRRGAERLPAVAKAAEGFSECPANSSDGTMRALREGERWQEKAAGDSLQEVHAHGRSAPGDGDGERGSRKLTSPTWSFQGHGGPRPAEERYERSSRDV